MAPLDGADTPPFIEACGAREEFTRPRTGIQKRDTSPPVVTDERLEAVIEAIQQAAGTGKIGDGKIFVTTIDQVIRIRTGEVGADAL